MNDLILKYLPFLFQAAAIVPEVYEYIQKVKAALKQENQWTPEMDAAFTAELEALKKSPPDWWKPESA